MVYIISLFLLLAIVFSATTGTNLVSGLWNNAVDKFENFVFPKTQKEIVIDNLNSQYDLLDRFFSDTALDLLQNKNISSEDKKVIQNAIKSFGNSKDLVSQIKNLTKDEKSLTKALIEKIFDPDTEPSPEPTYIPPNCDMICR